MNTLELLPKSIDYKGNTFFLQVTVTAWGHLCICYNQCGGDKKILSYVVEKNNSEYISDIIEKTGNCMTLDRCITVMIYKINELAQKEVLKAKYHD